MAGDLDLEPIKEFRRVAMAQYRRDVPELQSDLGIRPPVILHLDNLIAEVEYLRAGQPQDDS